MERSDRYLHSYSFYGYEMRSNVSFPFLDQPYDPEDIRHEIVFDVEYVDTVPSGPPLVEDHEGCSISLGDHICYRLSYKLDRFEIHTKSMEALVSTMFNLPMSVFLANKGGLLLHCSSVMHDGNVVSFCGEKGAGKSTWVSQCLDRFPFYSDDTLALFEEASIVKCKNAGSFIKLHEDSARIYGISEDQFQKLEKSIQGKAYVDVSDRVYSEEGQPSLKAVFHLSRHARDSVIIKSVSSNLGKTAILLTSVVGVRFYNDALLGMVRRSRVFHSIVSNVPFFRLYIPQDLNLLRDAAEEFSDMLSSLVDL